MTDLSPEDVAELRAQGDFRDYLRQITGRGVAAKPAPTAAAEPKPPAYHIARPGAWPCGTAPSGPTPPTCGNCPPHAGRTAA
ncbi:hypothetical protein [Streptomyces sp. UH6]|uniref:hypothetical protein n=1 Tax=Streptomyces sp. UH6 TaxID=2748379 RepID=UPI0015D4E6FE|nr:hypothetical protein [Streptomyces sp. UH6]NYV73122.1 hypothetical protein [Streptomyces sp. UH6]